MLFGAGPPCSGIGNKTAGEEFVSEPAKGAVVHACGRWIDTSKGGRNGETRTDVHRGKI